MSSVSSARSSMVITDSLTAMEDFPGFATADTESDDNVSDPFQGIFYHIMSLQDSTNILSYNQAIFDSIMTVLSKQFRFPSEETKNIQLKDQRKCTLSIDKTVMCKWTWTYVMERKGFQKVRRKSVQNIC